MRVAYKTANGRETSDFKIDIARKKLLLHHSYIPPQCLQMITTLHEPSRNYNNRNNLTELFSKLGTDATELCLFRIFNLHTKRSLSCVCSALCHYMRANLHSESLHVLCEDATVDNAAFVARLPNLMHLHVENETSNDINVVRIRRLKKLMIGNIGMETALFLGSILSSGNSDVTVRMQNGTSLINMKNVQINPRVNLSITTATDLAFFLGSLAKNHNLEKLELPPDIVLDPIVQELGHAIRF